jgi:hypothetical protein
MQYLLGLVKDSRTTDFDKVSSMNGVNNTKVMPLLTLLMGQTPFNIGIILYYNYDCDKSALASIKQILKLILFALFISAITLSSELMGTFAW